jgi:hypothetical protein
MAEEFKCMLVQDGHGEDYTTGLLAAIKDETRRNINQEGRLGVKSHQTANCFDRPPRAHIPGCFFLIHHDVRSTIPSGPHEIGRSDYRVIKVIILLYPNRTVEMLYR